MLRSLRKETSRFISESTADVAPTAKRDPPWAERGGGSAWARSGSKRGSQSSQPAPFIPSDRALDSLQAEKRTREAAPAYSFPRAVRPQPRITTNALSAISPQFEVLSTRKRAPGVKIAPETRKLAKTNDEALEEGLNAEYYLRYDRPDLKSPPRAFSFPRSGRFDGKSAESDGVSPTPLDVESGLRVTKPRAPCAVILKEAAPPAASDEACITGTVSIDPLSADAQQSHRQRVPAVVMKTRQSRSRIPLRSVSSSPGPYNVPSSFGISSSGGRFYHKEHSLRASARVAKAQASIQSADFYDTSAAEQYLRHVPQVHLKAFPESKLSDHLLRKRYWEEKTRIAREDHDECKDTNYDAVRPKTPSFHMRADEKRSRRRAEDKSIIEEIEEALGEDTSDLSQPSISYAAVEKRTPCPVRISSSSARDALLYSRPEVRAVVAQRELAEHRRRRYYGPQLQVPWAPEQKGIPHDEDDDNSPTKEVSQILDRGIRRSSSEPNMADAYLLSDLTGISRKGLKFRPENRAPRAVADVRDFVGPQTIRDWGKEASESSNRLHTIDFDLSRGREVVKIGRKGQQRVLHFDILAPEERMGNTAYIDLPQFGADAKGVAFSKLSRGYEDGKGYSETEGELDLDVDRAHHYLNPPTHIKLYRNVCITDR